ncbi:MAG: DUF4116 domain-containing protein, partial [Rickettsiales bacterium]
CQKSYAALRCCNSSLKLPFIKLFSLLLKFIRHRVVMSKLRQEVEKKSAGAYQSIFNADPSERKNSVPWLCKLFLANKLMLEDLPKATTYLPIFYKYRNNLSRKTLDEYTNLADLFTAIASHMPQHVYEEAPEANRSDVLTLYDQDGLSVRIPTSIAAAQRLGKGTQWCTAYEEGPNHFWGYAIQGPLLMVTTPGVNGKKQRFQLHFESGQFMDEGDSKIDLPELLRQYPKLLTVLKPYMNLEGELLYTPEDLRDRSMYESAVKKYGELLERVPEHLRDRSICEAAVRQAGEALKYVPKHLRDRSMCEAAVKQYGRALNWVPEELLDRSMCEAAVKSNGLALTFVPEHQRDLSMCEAAVKSNGLALEWVPEHLQDRSMCVAAVKSNGLALCGVPEHQRDLSMCEAAVKQNGDALCAVPEHLCDRSMCEAAVKQNGYALEYVPEHLRDRSMCVAAVKQNGEALTHVPEHLRDRSMCVAAVKQNGNALGWVPEHLMDRSMYESAVKQNGELVEWVPESITNKEFYSEVIQGSLTDKDNLVSLFNNARNKTPLNAAWEELQPTFTKDGYVDLAQLTAKAADAWEEHTQRQTATNHRG